MNILKKVAKVMRVLWVVGILGTLSVSSLAAQGLLAGGLFADQPAPGQERTVFPVRCPDGTFSSERPAISADGCEVYFSALSGWDSPGQYRICWYHFDGKVWKGPEVLFEGFLAPSLSPDGKTLYFQRIEKGNVSVWFARRTASAWGDAQSLKTAYPSLSYYTVADSGRVYAMCADTSTVGGTDLCVMDPAKGSEFVSLGKPLNTRGNDKDFYMAPDESFVVFTSADSSRAGTRQGELCVSFHKLDGTWTDPLTLGSQVNQAGDGGHWGPWVSRDASVLFFTTGNSPSSISIRWMIFGPLLDSLRRKALP